ncbi:MAG: hypothetical protein V1894_00560 [Chloroflexota bacterium]
MAVETREYGSTKRYVLHDVDKKETVHRYSHWRSFGQAKSDIIVTFTSSDRDARRAILFVEIKKSFEQSSYKQMTAYVQKLLLDNERPIWQPIVIAHLKGLLTPRAMGKLSESTLASPAIDVIYENRELVETLLGEQGKKVLRKTLVLIDNVARKFKWPLHRIEIQRASDVEVKNWNYVLLVLFFNSDFDTADGYLNLLYGELDSLATTLASEEQDILRRLIYFDVETTAMVSIS